MNSVDVNTKTLTMYKTYLHQQKTAFEYIDSFPCTVTVSTVFSSGSSTAKPSPRSTMESFVASVKQLREEYKLTNILVKT